ncbi:DNA polymerase Y family protein [Leucobacter luti]|uniref:DNA polymerase Y family protein n=1 Tax=Leucobacter luti TaxID=340320 RepID=UPI003CFC8B77
MTSGERALVFWVPDWPIHAFLEESAEFAEDQENTERERAAAQAAPASASASVRAAAPLALVADHQVVACSETARAGGVHPGLREREAQSRCPELEVHPHDPEVDARRFAPVLAAIEGLIPGVEPRRPGLCAMRARGPVRYYGGEQEAATALFELAEGLGISGARIGFADGLFAAEQAARSAAGSPGVEAPLPRLRIVQPGGSPAFLSPLPISRAAAPALAEVLHGLGIRTLGAFAALPEDAVRQRFGAEGVAAHHAARGTVPVRGAEVRPRTPPRELTVELEFEPPIETAEQLAFACATLAERFIDGIARERLVCTALRLELTDDVGARHEREWAHPRRFTASDTLGRIRWQASGIARETERGGAGIARVRITPTHTDRASAHEPGLWSTEPDERIHHHLSRAQSRLGHTGVGTVSLAGGRLLADRQRFVPWGTTRRGKRARGARDSGVGPWPGALPGPAPSRIFPDPLPAALAGPRGEDVGIDADDLLTARPERLSVAGSELAAEVSGWSRPWPIRERWWAGTPPRFRLQLQLANGDAWLLLREPGRWLAEGRYD